MTHYPDFVDIKLPKEAADSYYMKKTQHLVSNFIYIDSEWSRKIFDPTTFYILGPKGSGKTLYAAYMCADLRNNTLSKYHTISVDDYGKIISMKKKGHLSFTDFTTIWKVILLQKFLCSIDADSVTFWGRDKNFKSIQKTISDYFGYDVTNDEFNPVTIIDSFGKQDEVTAFLNTELGITSPISALLNAKAGMDEKTLETVSSSVEAQTSRYTDTWLRSINSFKNALENIAFKHNHYLFIDGLDVRPPDLDAEEYGNCISALIRAVYDLNTKVFGSMDLKDDREFKIIALTRTDIFLNSNLVNVTSCINDNCVELDWTYGNEKNFMYSKLYKMMNRVLGWDGITGEMPVQIYFGFDIAKYGKGSLKAAMYIQRLSRLRPRDIVTMLNLIQEECRSRGCKNPDPTIINSSEIIDRYSNYYIEQIKSELRFSYSEGEVFHIFNLITTVNKHRLSEDEFRVLYDYYCERVPKFKTLFSSHRALVDLLYSLDVVGWCEFDSYTKKVKVHWHYRETKAIDEQHRLPWEKYESVSEAKLVIHTGATKYIVGRYYH